LTYLSYRTAFKEFYNIGPFLFAVSSGDAIAFQNDVPTLDKLKKKVVLVIKARQDKTVDITDANV